MFGYLGPASNIMTALLLSLLVSLTAPVSGSSGVDSVRITYVGNEGFLIESGGKKVLIDALYRAGVSGYVVHTPDVRKLLERALPPFDNLDLILATHFHADHFDPDAVGIHLLSDRNAFFLTTNQAAGQMESYQGYRNIQARVKGILPEEGQEEVLDYGGMQVHVFNLHHGRGRPVENLGFLIVIGDRTFLHVGDTEVSTTQLASYGLQARDIDFLFVPYWFLLDNSEDVNIVSTIGPHTVIPMHLPPKDDPRSFMADTGGFEGTVARIASNYPNAVVFEEPMTTKTFP